MAYTNIDDPSAHFQTVLWTGNTSAPRSITNDGNSNLQPDWVWGKNRTSAGTDHEVYDSNRGTGTSYNLKTSSTAVEGISTTYGQLTSFDTDGFTVNAGGTNDDFWNENHTSKMIDGYLLDKNNLLYAQTPKFKWSKLFINNDLLFINPLIHSSCLFNLNICNFIYPDTNQPYDDLKAYIKIKYLLKKNIKILNFKTCKVNTTRSGRWSNQSKSFKKKEYLKKLFLLALKKKLNIKKINLITMFKLFYNYNIFQILFILYKIHQN